MSQRIKAGPVTLALGLIGLGVGMLVYNFGGLTSVQSLWRYWPLLLIGLGVEYFVRRLLHREREVVFHIPSAMLIGLIIATGLVSNAMLSLGLNQILEDIVFGNRVGYTRQWQSEPLEVAAGSGLRVESKNDALELRGSDDGALHVRAEIVTYGSTEEKARADSESREIVIEKGATTKIYTRYGEALRRGGGSINLTVEVPAGLSIEVVNNNGKVEITNVKGQLNVRTDNGGVHVLGLDGRLEVNTENGQITVSAVTGNVVTNTRNGQIRVENPGGDVQARTGNGNIELSSIAPLSKTYLLSSSSGSLDFRLPGGSDLAIEAKTRNGIISGMNENTESEPTQLKSDSLKLGNGKGRASLNTENGQIQVHVE